MATLFDNHSASDLSEWSGTVTDGGKLAYSGSAGMGGTTGGIAMTASNAAKYVYMNFTALSGNYFRTRWYYNPNTINTVGSNENWWMPYNAGGVVQRGYLQYNNSTNTLVHSFRDDGGTFRSESIGSVTMSAGDYIEIFTQKSTGSGNTDAIQRVYKNWTLLGSGITGYILFTTFNWDQSRYGHCSTQHASFTGIEYFDEIKATTDATAIGGVATNEHGAVQHLRNLGVYA